MSSTQSKTLSFDPNSISGLVENTESGLQVNYSYFGSSYSLHTTQTSFRYTFFKSTARNSLYPNSTAHPIKADINLRGQKGASLGTAQVQVCINGQEAWTGAFTGVSASDSNGAGLSVSCITQSTRSSEIKIGAKTSSGLGESFLLRGSIIFYFTRYDFSAVAGTGVTSASASSSTGYDGDTLTFSCVIPAGYVFDGWYNGNTLVSSSQSYTHTVSGADLALTAKAHQNTHSVNGTYNGSTKAILSGISGDVAVGYNGKTKTLNVSSASHTLSCANKVMRGNVSVGSASLATGGKVMRSDLVLNYV